MYVIPHCSQIVKHVEHVSNDIQFNIRSESV